MDVLGRYRNLIVLVGVLFAQVLGLAVQVKRIVGDRNRQSVSSRMRLSRFLINAPSPSSTMPR